MSPSANVSTHSVRPSQPMYLKLCVMYLCYHSHHGMYVMCVLSYCMDLARALSFGRQAIAILHETVVHERLLRLFARHLAQHIDQYSANVWKTVSSFDDTQYVITTTMIMTGVQYIQTMHMKRYRCCYSHHVNHILLRNGLMLRPSTPRDLIKRSRKS